MNTVQKLVSALVLSIPIASGCSQSSNNGRWEQFSIHDLDKTYSVKAEEFDTEKRGYLTTDDVEKYVKEVIDDGDGKISQAEVYKIQDARDHIAFGAPAYRDPKTDKGVCPPKIEKTITSFEKVRDKYQGLIYKDLGKWNWGIER